MVLDCSDFRNALSTPSVPPLEIEPRSARHYHGTMFLERDPDWHLESWMLVRGMSQAELQRLAKWSKRKASQLVTGTQRYNRQSLNEAARALDIQPYELLLHPDTALQIRGFMHAVEEQALRLVAEPGDAFRSTPSSFTAGLIKNSGPHSSTRNRAQESASPTSRRRKPPSDAEN